MEGGTQFLILSVHGITLPNCDGVKLLPDSDKEDASKRRDSTTCAAYSTCCQFVRLGQTNTVSKSDSKMLRKSEMYVCMRGWNSNYNAEVVMNRMYFFHSEFTLKSLQLILQIHTISHTYVSLEPQPSKRVMSPWCASKIILGMV